MTYLDGLPLWWKVTITICIVAIGALELWALRIDSARRRAADAARTERNRKIDEIHALVVGKDAPSEAEPGAR